MEDVNSVTRDMISVYPFDIFSVSTKESHEHIIIVISNVGTYGIIHHLRHNISYCLLYYICV